LLVNPIIKYTDDAVTHTNEGKSLVSYFKVDAKDVVQASVSLLTYKFMPNSCSIAEKIVASKIISDVSVNQASLNTGYAISVLGQVATSYIIFSGVAYTGKYHLLEKNSAIVGLVISTAPDLAMLGFSSAQFISSKALEYAEIGYNSVMELYNNYLAGMDSTTGDSGL
jgi:hypothetical protein